MKVEIALAIDALARAKFLNAQTVITKAAADSMKGAQFEYEIHRRLAHSLADKIEPTLTRQSGIAHREYVPTELEYHYTAEVVVMSHTDYSLLCATLQRLARAA